MLCKKTQSLSHYAYPNEFLTNLNALSCWAIQPIRIHHLNLIFVYSSAPASVTMTCHWCTSGHVILIKGGREPLKVNLIL